MLLKKEYFKDHPLWQPLELELHRRRNQLDNAQLSQVVHAFGVMGSATKFLFQDLEETIIDSPIPWEAPNAIKILSGYAQVDQGSPILYKVLMDIVKHEGLHKLTLQQIANMSKDLSRVSQLPKGSQPFFDLVEKHVKTEIEQGRITDFR